MTAPTRRPNYTPEVEAAMRSQGLLPAEPEPDAPPAGTVRYYVAVEGVTSQNGVAAPATLAAILRSLADQLDPKENPDHG